MLIKPYEHLSLPYHAAFREARPDLLVAASAEGYVTVIGPDFTVQHEFRRPGKVRSISIHPTLPLIAWVDEPDGRLAITDLTGAIQFETRIPKTTRGMPTWNQLGFGNCHFDASGTTLWTVAPISDTEIEIHARDCETWAIVDTTIVEDPFGESSASVEAAPSPYACALWLAAGQDGQQVFWITRGPGQITVTAEPKLVDTTPPIFSPSEREFLVIVSDDTTLSKYQFPDVKLLGSGEWPADEKIEDEEDQERFGYELCFLNENWALVTEGEGRTFLWDVAKMTLGDEVIIENHEPKPTSELYPSLKGDKLCAVLSSAMRFGDFIVMAHGQITDTGLSNDKNTLLRFPVSSLLGGRA